MGSPGCVPPQAALPFARAQLPFDLSCFSEGRLCFLLTGHLSPPRAACDLGEGGGRAACAWLGLCVSQPLGLQFGFLPVGWFLVLNPRFVLPRAAPSCFLSPGARLSSRLPADAGGFWSRECAAAVRRAGITWESRAPLARASAGPSRLQALLLQQRRSVGTIL